MHEFGVPGWFVALAVALVFSAAAALIAVATGAFAILLPALAIVALAYAIYVAITARRRGRLYDGLVRRLSMIQDGRPLRRRSRRGD